MSEPHGLADAAADALAVNATIDAPFLTSVAAVDVPDALVAYATLSGWDEAALFGRAVLARSSASADHAAVTFPGGERARVSGSGADAVDVSVAALRRLTARMLDAVVGAAAERHHPITTSDGWPELVELRARLAAS